MKIFNKALILLALPLALAAPASSQQPTDLIAEGLKGPVKTVSGHSSESRSSDGHQSKGADTKLDSLTFDSSGRLVKRAIYDYDGTLRGTAEYSRDTAGNLIASGVRDPDGSIRDKQVQKYQNGRLSEITSLDGNGSVGLRDVFTYDQSGSLQEVTHYYLTQLMGRTSFTSDATGNLIEATFFQPNGSKATAPIGPCYNAHRVAYIYDKDRRVTNEITYNLDGSVKRKSSYRYDNNGNIAEESQVDFHSTLKDVYTYEYDRNGNWTRQIVEAHTSRLPLFGDKRNESQRRTVKQRIITYY